MGTATQILAALEAYDLKSGRDGYYTCNSPLRPGSNSHAFQLHIINEEHGGYIDFARQGEAASKGSLYKLAKALKIELPEREPAMVTKREYTGLADYAAAHYSTAEVFAAAGWKECTKNYRRALSFPTTGGMRYRYLDGDNKRRFDFDTGGKASWYGFKLALPQAAETGQPLIFANGEPSVVVAQSYGLPAVAVTSGEKDAIKPDLLAQLVKDYPPGEDDHEIIIATDCDTQGRLAAPGLVACLRAAGYKTHAVDLMLTDGGDLADFCGLHQESAYADFCKLPELKAEAHAPTPAAEPKVSVLVSWQEASERARAGYHDHAELTDGVPLPVPFNMISQFEGQAALLEPGNVMCIGAPTGHAKTSLMEAFMDHWRRDRGVTGALWGPEFRPDFYVYKAIQRAGGPPANQVRWHKLAMRGMTDRSGLTKAEIELSEELDAQIRAWKGTLYFVDKMGITIHQVIENYKEAIDKNGKPIGFAVLDYAQLVLGEKSASTVESNLAEFKSFCVDYHAVGLVGSQLTKAGSSSGGWIDLEDLRYMNGDYFNCIVTVCRQEDLQGKFLPDAKMSVVKNSLGSCGRGTLLLHPKTMLWQDPIMQTINLEKGTVTTQVPM